MFKVIAIMAATCSLSSAASISFAAAADVDVRLPVSAGGAQLGPAFTARIGFLAPGATFTSTSNFADVNAVFTSAGQVNFASGDLAGANGYFAGNATFTDAGGFAGKDVVIWITDGSNANAVLRSNTVDFLADSAIPNANSVDIAAAFMNSFTFLLGSHNPDSPNSANGGSVILNVVPEPSAALLGLLGAVGLIRRRR